MADKPIFFSGPMIRAVLDGRKTQTRRVLKPVKGLTLGDLQDEGEREGSIVRCARHQVQEPPYAPGDRLWVREAWRTLHATDCLAPRHLAADPSKVTFEADPERRNPLWAFGKLRPGMFMPRWASRLTLIVTDVRVQRLQDISNEDARDEGVDRRSRKVRQMWLFGADQAERDRIYLQACKWEFEDLWDSLNAKRGCGWAENPWVCAVTFTAQQRNIDQMPEGTGERGLS